MITTVTSKGQVTLPVSVRKALKIKSGDKLDIEVTENGEIRGTPIKSSLASLSEILPKSRRKLSHAQIEAAIRKGASKSL